MAREFVLVHGMSHGGWWWEPLARRLEKDGHRVVAMDLPGHGRRAHERARASVDGYARAVADAMIQAGVARGIVVGHSMGGMVIPKVAPPGDRRVVDALIRMTPQPLEPWTERVSMQRFYAMDVPRTYVRCLRDAAVPAAQYAARLGVTPIDIDCAHSPVLSALDDLVMILRTIPHDEGAR